MKISHVLSWLQVRRFLYLIAIAAVPLCSVQAAHSEALSEQEISDIAREAYLYGLPLVSDYALMYSYAVNTDDLQFKAPFNHIKSISSFLTPEDDAVPYPNNDTLYSAVWFDLRAEPQILYLPPLKDNRYTSLMLIDGSTVIYGLVTTRTQADQHIYDQASAGGTFMIVAPDWQGEIPAGIDKVFRSTTDFSLAVYRIQYLGEGDVEQIQALQAALRVKPLSEFTGTPPAAEAPRITFPHIDRELAQTHFFAYLDFVLKFAPVRPEEKEIRMQLARIGIGTEHGFNRIFLPLAQQHRSALLAGVQAAQEQLNRYISAQSAEYSVNGWDWSPSHLNIDRTHYQGDYVKRAAVFVMGPYGLNPYEASYPLIRALPGGKALDGSSHRYSITFAPEQLPPVDSFWSLTLYDAQTRSFSANAFNRYLVNSLMLPTLTRNADHSITIYIQHDHPGNGLEVNWLPAPAGPFHLMLRLYGPKQDAFDGRWKIPPVMHSPILMEQ